MARRVPRPVIAVGLAGILIGAFLTGSPLMSPQTLSPVAALPSTAPPERLGPTVAVLPFAALTEGERWELLAGGLTQDVISDLARNEWVSVLGEATSRAISMGDPLAAARRLGADYLASGSIQVAGERARVAAALTNSQTGLQIWSTRFEGPVSDLLSMQVEASEAIVGDLAARWSGPIGSAERAKARGRGVTDLTAYELVLVAGERIKGYAPGDIEAAIDLVKQAVDRAPDYR